MRLAAQARGFSAAKSEEAWRRAVREGVRRAKAAGTLRYSDAVLAVGEGLPWAHEALPPGDPTHYMSAWWTASRRCGGGRAPEDAMQDIQDVHDAMQDIQRRWIAERVKLISDMLAMGLRPADIERALGLDPGQE